MTHLTPIDLSRLWDSEPCLPADLIQRAPEQHLLPALALQGDGTVLAGADHAGLAQALRDQEVVISDVALQPVPSVGNLARLVPPGAPGSAPPAGSPPYHQARLGLAALAATSLALIPSILFRAKGDDLDVRFGARLLAAADRRRGCHVMADLWGADGHARRRVAALAGAVDPEVVLDLLTGWTPLDAVVVLPFAGAPWATASRGYHPNARCRACARLYLLRRRADAILDHGVEAGWMPTEAAVRCAFARLVALPHPWGG